MTKLSTTTPNTYSRIYRIVKQIPKGKVATYGQIAALTGIPGGARQVGYALHNLKDNNDVPWYRVINSKGQISQLPDPLSKSIQHQLLLSEGIKFSDKGVIKLSKFQWYSENSMVLNLES
ncbi:MAG: MGMT family protein [Calditrichia bacterium]|nr:MGMT family protein [Calditrichia bacterium]